MKHEINVHESLVFQVHQLVLQALGLLLSLCHLALPLAQVHQAQPDGGRGREPAERDSLVLIIKGYTTRCENVVIEWLFFGWIYLIAVTVY